ncbi:MAG TPA: hypothetical protein VIH58_00785, partial [Chthoniobacterales bacterium]
RARIEKRDLEEAWRICLGHRRAENHPQPPAPPSPPPGQRFNPSFGPRTSVAPINSLPDPKRLPVPKPSINQPLRDWAKKLLVGVPSREVRVASGTSETVSRGSVNWIATLLSSVPINKISRIRLRYYSVRRVPRVWCFLDASRSTGMSRCLSAARDSLIDLASYFRSRRWNLLLLRDNQVRWVLKQSSFRSFRTVLTQVDSAGGKSYLFQSLNSLHRTILKNGATAQDRVVIVSDGLASLEAGQRHRDTPSRLRHYLRRISKLNVSTAWLYPSTERALVNWLQKILRGLPVTSIKL